jgi:hypothetical protein
LKALIDLRVHREAMVIIKKIVGGKEEQVQLCGIK